MEKHSGPAEGAEKVWKNLRTKTSALMAVSGGKKRGKNIEEAQVARRAWPTLCVGKKLIVRAEENESRWRREKESS